MFCRSRRFSNNCSKLLKAGKCERCTFSTWSNDSTWLPNLMLQNRNIQINSIPCLLGVLLDRGLTFSAHVDKVNADLWSKVQAMKVVSHFICGWQKLTLKTMYHAFIRIKIDYTAPAWQPWLSKSDLTRMETFQNCVLWIATGQLEPAPIEAMQMEANIQSYTIFVKQITLNVSLLSPMFHNGFLQVTAGEEKLLSYLIYFLTLSTNVNHLICSQPLHWIYQILTN